MLILLMTITSFAVFLVVIALNQAALTRVEEMNRALLEGPMAVQDQWRVTALRINGAEAARKQFLLDLTPESGLRTAGLIQETLKELPSSREEGGPGPVAKGLESYRQAFDTMSSLVASNHAIHDRLGHQRESVETQVYEMENRAMETILGELLVAQMSYFAEKKAERAKSVEVLLDRFARDMAGLKGEAALVKELSAYRALFVDIAANDKAVAEQSAVMEQRAEEMRKAVKDQLNAAQDAAQQAVEISRQETATAHQRAMFWTAFGVALAVIISVLFERAMKKQLGCDPALLAKIARRVAMGDLTRDATQEEKGECGVYSDLRGMSSKLMEIVGEIQQSADIVGSGSRELSATSHTLSEGAMTQAGSIQQTSASMTLMNEKIQRNTETAQQTERIAFEAAQNASSSESTVMRAMGAMKEIAGRISIIEEIARQTNLLALNAAIE
ncbi:MAG: hypothetical protein HQL51_15515, partial [Magnetococcales bacterium]|nr:hypothetical protein [Magnetococcales bacterium]